MSDRTSISVPEAVYEEAKALKGDRTWGELVLDGAHAGENDGQEDDSHDDSHPKPLTADDVGMLASEVASEVENRLTRR